MFLYTKCVHIFLQGEGVTGSVYILLILKQIEKVGGTSWLIYAEGILLNPMELCLCVSEVMFIPQDVLHGPMKVNFRVSNLQNANILELPRPDFFFPQEVT